MRTSDEVQAAMVAYLKSKSAITSLLKDSKEIRESYWQGVDFTYPNIRVCVDFVPSINGCGPDKADITIESFSEEKSSREAELLSNALTRLLHKHPFSVSVQLPNQSAVTVKFPIVVVEKTEKAERSIYGWLSRTLVRTQVV